MKKIISTVAWDFICVSLLTLSVANAAASEVRVAYFLEWPYPKS